MENNEIKNISIGHHSIQSTIGNEKRRITNLDRYGVTTNLLHNDTKKKIKETNLKIFGVEHNSQSEVVKEKKKQTNLKNCGVECNLMSDDFKIKSKITTLEKYGVEHTSLSSEIRKKQCVTKRKNKITEFAIHLGIDVKNISFDEDMLTINNYCKIHDSFNITINQFHQRRFKYNNKICAKCYPMKKQNSGSEIELKNFVKSLNFKQNNNNKKILGDRFEIDILLPENNLAIEFDGLYWHSTVYKNNDYHLNKTEECEKQGIQLIHVFEDDWMYRKETVKSIIKSTLGVFDYNIFAFKCTVIEIDSKASSDFLNQNHIQGKVDTTINIGLTYENELVSLMCFDLINGEYELLRVCNKLNTRIMGGEVKQLSYFIEKYNPNSILASVDRRYSNGEYLKQIGFNFVENTEPNCWHFNTNELIRGKILSNNNENQEEHKGRILSIYDCGEMKFKLKL